MSPAILDETVVPFALAHKQHRSHPTYYQVRNWARKGIQGFSLEYYKVGGTPVTSHEAIDRFLTKINATYSSARAKRLLAQ